MYLDMLFEYFLRRELFLTNVTYESSVLNAVNEAVIYETRSMGKSPVTRFALEIFFIRVHEHMAL